MTQETRKNYEDFLGCLKKGLSGLGSQVWDTADVT